MTSVAATQPTRRRHPGVRELGLFALAYLTYFGVRAVTVGDAPQALENAARLIEMERSLGIAVEGAFQETILQHPALVDAANAVYMYGHWPVILIGGFLLFRYRRAQYYRLRNAFLLTGVIGLVIFATFPVAPPRLTDLPVVDTVTEGAEGYRQVLPSALVNEYAAMPSFHVGWNVLLGIVVFGAVRNRALRALAVAGPAAMAVAVVATANHFVLDAVAGTLIVLAALTGLKVAERRRARGTIDDRGGAGRAVRRRAPRRQRSAHAASRTGARLPAHRS